MRQFGKNWTNNFIKNGFDNALLSQTPNSFVNFMTEDFDDLDKLNANARPRDIEKAIRKYTSTLRVVIDHIKKPNFNPSCVPEVLHRIHVIMTKARLIPVHGHQLAASLSRALGECEGLKLLISYCRSDDNCKKFSSMKLLEHCLIEENNKIYVAQNGLEEVVAACALPSDLRVTKTGILKYLFEHNESTSENVIRFGGLDAILKECRYNDVNSLQNCAKALANLSLHAGTNDRNTIIKHEVLAWLFPLAFHNDRIINYYACLAIAVLVSNEVTESEVLKSDNLIRLLKKFTVTNRPIEIVEFNLASRDFGQTKEWLKKFIPILDSAHADARNMAAFFFCVEANIKKSQGDTEVFRQIGVIEHLKRVAGHSDTIASDFAVQALEILGEDINAVFNKSLDRVDKNAINSSKFDDDWLMLLNQDIENGIQWMNIASPIRDTSENSCVNCCKHNSLEKKIDVFISYRRSNGSYLASLLKVYLQIRKFHVFIDVEELGPGKFDEHLLCSIRESKNFLLVLTPNALDRCLNDSTSQDWVHKEIAVALQPESHCKIIPVTTDQFTWPKSDRLPKDIRIIDTFNAIQWSHEYQDACVNKIEKFINEKDEERCSN